MTFADPFFGNPGVIGQLDQRLRQGRLPHAMIFAGPDGVGKRTCAVRLAQTLNCTAGKEGPCGLCTDCRKIENGTHPDVRLWSLDEGASQIKIEQVRELRSMLGFEPLEGVARVFLIDPAERMTPAAANALLKTLEEPPQATYLLLITTNASDLLVTIRSRAQTYFFTPVSLEEIRRTGIEDELVLRWSQGSVGRALLSDPEELKSRRETVLRFIDTALGSADEALVDLLACSAELSRSKEDYPDRMRVLAVLVADLLYLKQRMVHRIVNFDIQERLERLQADVSVERLVEIADCLKRIEANLKRYVNRQMMSDQLALVANPTTGEILNDKSRESR